METQQSVSEAVADILTTNICPSSTSNKRKHVAVEDKSNRSNNNDNKSNTSLSNSNKQARLSTGAPHATTSANSSSKKSANANPTRAK